MAPQRPRPDEEDVGGRARVRSAHLPPVDKARLAAPSSDDDEEEENSAEAVNMVVVGRPSSEDDEELTSLTWLQDRNLLQSCISGAAAPSNGATAGLVPYGSPPQRPPAACHVPPSSGSPGGGGSSSELYNPAVHVCAKPPYSFSCLIFMAIEDSRNRALPVKDIYSWIVAHFPYFRNAPVGWKNSVRHNLSLNKCFFKVDKGQNVAKGSLWCVDPEYRPNLLQALRKTPYSPHHHIRLLSDPPPVVAPCIVGLNSTADKGCTNMPNPDLFPYLSKRLAASATKDPEVDAAATMLALKHGPRIMEMSGSAVHNGAEMYQPMGNGVIHLTKERRHDRLQERLRTVPSGAKMSPLSVCVPVITTSPNEDHTYSSVTNSPTQPTTTSNSPGSSIDEPFEFGGCVAPVGHNHHHHHHQPPQLPATREAGDDGVDGDSGGDSGVTHSVSSDSDDDPACVMEEDDDEDTVDYEAEPVRRPVIMRTVTMASGHRKVILEDEEQQKIVEGADALLNLAGVGKSSMSLSGCSAKMRRKETPPCHRKRHLLISLDEAQR